MVLLACMGPLSLAVPTVGGVSQSTLAPLPALIILQLEEDRELNLILLEPPVVIAAHSSLDKVLIPPSFSLLEDNHQYQELLHRKSLDLGIPLKEIQDQPHELLDVLQPQELKLVVLPVNDAILQPSRAI